MDSRLRIMENTRTLRNTGDHRESIESSMTEGTDQNEENDNQ